MNASVLIRAATVNDLEDVLQLERAVAGAPHWSRAEYEAMVRAENEQSTMRRCLLIAEIDGVLAGFAVGKLVRAAEVGELESVAVRPSARRMGVGGRLCREVMDWCRSQGAMSMELEVRSANGDARRLYEGLGFVVEGVRKGYYTGPVDDAVLMRQDFRRAGKLAGNAGESCG